VCLRTEVLVTLTTDVGKLLSKLNQVRPKGNINFVSAIRIAHVSNKLCLCSALTLDCHYYWATNMLLLENLWSLILSLTFSSIYFISFIVLVICLHLPNFACNIIFILTTFIIGAQIAGIFCIVTSCEIRKYYDIVAGGQASLPACLPVTIL